MLCIGDMNTRFNAYKLTGAQGDCSTMSLPRNFSWTLAGNLVYAACQWGYLVLLAHYTRPEVVGRFALGLAIAAPVFMFCNLNLRAVQATDAENHHTLHDFIGLRLITSIVALFIILVVLGVAGYTFEVSMVVVVIAVMKFVESLIGVLYGFFQKHEQMGTIARSMMLRGLVSVALFGVSLLLFGELLPALSVVVGVWILCLYAYDLPQTRKLVSHTTGRPFDSRGSGFRLNLRTIYMIFFMSLPLGFVMLFNSLNTNIPKYFVESVLGEYELGIYAALAYVMVAGVTVIAALGQAAVPRLAKLYVQRERRKFVALVCRLCALSSGIGLAAFILALMAGDKLLKLAYGASFAEAQPLLVMLMFASIFCFLSSMLGYVVTSARMFNQQVPIALISVVTCIILSYLLVGSFGLEGAAITVLTVFIVQIILKSIVVFRAVQFEG